MRPYGKVNILYENPDCSACGSVLILGANWKPWARKSGHTLCNDCMKKRRHDSYLEHQAETIARATAYTVEHHEERLAYWKENYSKHKDRFAEDEQRRYRELRLKVLGHYSPELKCVRCGYSTFAALSVDHISGGGRRQVKISHKGSPVSFYRWLVKRGFPPDFRVLCMNCQRIVLLEGVEKHDRHSKYRWMVKSEVLDHYGRFCAHCNFADIRALVIDHVKNNGAVHRRKLGIVGGGFRFYLWLRRNGFPEGYQTLCQNCNFSKERDR